MWHHTVFLPKHMHQDSLSGCVNLPQLFDPAGALSCVDSLAFRGTHVSNHRGIVCALFGTPQLIDDGLVKKQSQIGLAQCIADLWVKHGEDLPSHLLNGYSLVIVDGHQRSVFLAVDKFAVRPLCYQLGDAVVSFSDRADCVGEKNSVLDPQALYDYLYFHMIPAPRTVFKGVLRLPASHSILITPTGSKISRHWPLNFTEMKSADLHVERDNVRALIDLVVAGELPGHERVGAFLSGGIDSSTVAGTLRKMAGKPMPAYSIGFEAEGFDEMAFARLAAKHFDLEHHEYYVTPADMLKSIPDVAKFYDQPFGNSSALPAYFCAKMAKEDGCSKILAGDGGDELFGGNTRYSFQQFLHLYRWVPGFLQKLIEPFCGETSPLRRIPGLRQILGYVRHSSVKMPHRLHTMNLVEALGPSTILHASLLKQIDTELPAKLIESVWKECNSPALVNQMLAYDWRFTLADSDLPKVQGAGAMASISVGYPLLDTRLVEYSMRLPTNWKVKLFRLRWFFKKAMSNFLPEAVIRKKKQGFGLPYGTWTVKSPELLNQAKLSLKNLVDRNIIQQQFSEDLLAIHLPEAPGYYGNMVWLLVILDHWLQAHPKAHLPA